MHFSCMEQNGKHFKKLLFIFSHMVQVLLNNKKKNVTGYGLFVKVDIHTTKDFMNKGRN